MKDLLKRIKRTIDFLPIIWRGEDFDYRYSLELFQYQLERTADFLDSKMAYSNDAKRNSFRIRGAVELIQKVYDEEYAMEWVSKIEEEYGEDAMKFEFVPFKETGHYELKYSYENWDNAEEIRERIQELILESNKKQKKAEQVLWKWINHNIKNWWD